MESSASMPLILQYIGFFISVIGFIVTIATFVATKNVKRTIILQSERESFRNAFEDINGRIEGFINSITEDNIYLSSSITNFQLSISQFLVDIETKFSFLSLKSRIKIKSLKKSLKNQTLSANDWRNISEELTALKNYLRKEKFVL